MDWLTLVIGLVAGIAIGFVIVKLNSKTKSLEYEKQIEKLGVQILEEKSFLEKEQSVLNERIKNLTIEKEKLGEKLDSEGTKREEA